MDQFSKEGAVKLITKDSLRPSKRQRVTVIQDDICQQEKDDDMTALDVDLEDDIDEKPKRARQPKRARTRQWELWGRPVKDAFFDGISEFGKDFDKIYSHIKHKRTCKTKTRSQIRHFYYRTLKQISTALTKKPEKLKKVDLEILGLICYNEMRRKGATSFDHKFFKKLETLVTTGSTVVRYKGRNVKVRIPTCKAVKKIYGLPEVETQPQIYVPKTLNVELLPKSNFAWSLAQKAACNPRLRLSSVPSVIKLEKFFKLLQCRFKDNAVKSPSGKLYHITLCPTEDTYIESKYLKSYNLYSKNSSEFLSPEILISSQGSTDKENFSKSINTTEDNSSDFEEDPDDDVSPVKSGEDNLSSHAIPCRTSKKELKCIESSKCDCEESCNCQCDDSNSTYVCSPSSPGVTVDDVPVEDDTNIEDDVHDDSDNDIDIVHNEDDINDISTCNDSYAWTLVEDGDLDLQHLYLAFGQPNLIKLLYDWKEDPIESVTESSNLTEPSLQTSIASGESVQPPVTEPTSNCSTPTDLVEQPSTVAELTMKPFNAIERILWLSNAELQNFTLPIIKPVPSPKPAVIVSKPGPSLKSSSASKQATVTKKSCQTKVKQEPSQLKTKQESHTSSASSTVSTITTTSAPVPIVPAYVRPAMSPSSSIIPSPPSPSLTPVSLKIPISSQEFAIPSGRKRGRTPNTRSSFNIVHRNIIPRLKPVPSSSRTLLPGAVAVNIVPQPAQLIQYGKVPAASAQLTNTADNIVSVGKQHLAGTSIATLNTINLIANAIPDIRTVTEIDKSSRNPSGTLSVQVVDEGSASTFTNTQLTDISPCSTQSIEQMNIGSNNLSHVLGDMDLSNLPAMVGSDSLGHSVISQIDLQNISLSSILAGLTQNLASSGGGSTQGLSSLNYTANATNIVKSLAGSIPAVTATPSTATSSGISANSSQSTTDTSVQNLSFSAILAGLSQSLSTAETGSPQCTPCTNNSLLSKTNVSNSASTNTSSLLMAPVKTECNVQTKMVSSTSNISLSLVTSGLLQNAVAKEVGSNEATSVSQLNSSSLRPTSSPPLLMTPIKNVLNTPSKNNPSLTVSSPNYDPQWNPEIGEISLGSLLGESCKEPARIPTSQDSSSGSDFSICKPGNDVLSALDIMMDENSVDYINKFKALTAKMVASASTNNSGIVSTSYQDTIQTNKLASALPESAKDLTLPIGTSEDSVGPLDGLSFVLPTADGSNSSDSLKAFA